MLKSKSVLCVAILTACLGFCLSADGAAPAKKKPKAGRRATLLEIPKVGKDKVICFALYTVHDNILKLTAQLYPLDKGDPRTVRLEVKQDNVWKQVAETKIVMPGWTAPFRVVRVNFSSRS